MTSSNKELAGRPSSGSGAGLGRRQDRFPSSEPGRKRGRTQTTVYSWRVQGFGLLCSLGKYEVLSRER